MISKAEKFYHKGLYKQAESVCREVLKNDGSNVVTLRTLSLALLKTGRVNEGVEYLKTALLHAPHDADNNIALGLYSQALNRMPEAVNAFSRAYNTNPDKIEALLYLAEIHTASNDYGNAAACLAAYINKNPKDSLVNQSLVESMRYFRYGECNAAQIEAMLHVLDDYMVSPVYLYDNWLYLIKNLPEYTALAKALTSQEECNFADFRQALNSPLFVKGIERLRTRSYELEILLTKLRRFLMTQWDADKAFDLAGYTPVLSALATLCWVNEYAFYCTDEEEALLKKLEERIVSIKADDFDEEAVALLYLYSCYNAANRIEGVEGKIKNAVKQFGSAFERFVQLQISDYFEEQRLKPQIRQLTAIDDAVSAEVRAMYEESPYPRRNDFWLLDESKNLDMSSYDVLFAGCGTGHQVLGFSQLYRNSKFTGVDLSLSSLAFATRLARQKKKNVTYAQADILKLDRLPKKYDRIYCTGVLHHMDDPEKGLAVLKNILKPGGVMRLAYYSEAARQDIVQARAYIAEHGYEATTEGIRRFRHDMIALQLQDKAPAFMKAIFNQYDFYTLSECRDLLFHVQEHRYTLPQITDMLERHDLELISFNIGSKNTLAAFMKEFPTADINDPAAWHEFEQIHPMTFIGMYDFNVGHKR